MKTQLNILVNVANKNSSIYEKRQVKKISSENFSELYKHWQYLVQLLVKLNNIIMRKNKKSW